VHFVRIVCDVAQLTRKQESQDLASARIASLQHDPDQSFLATFLEWTHPQRAPDWIGTPVAVVT